MLVYKILDIYSTVYVQQLKYKATPNEKNLFKSSIAHLVTQYKPEK
jgi:hypothetical protein